MQIRISGTTQKVPFKYRCIVLRMFQQVIFALGASNLDTFNINLKLFHEY